MGKTQQPIELFYSYAQPDEKLRVELETHLSPLVRQYQIMPWHQQKVIPGSDRLQEIDTHLDTAQIILLLVSPDFLASDYYSAEMQHALKRHTDRRARVIPILIRPADWQRTPFAGLELLPGNREPVTSWSNQDKAWQDVVQGIRSAIEELFEFPAAQSEEKSLEQRQISLASSVNGLDRPATVFLSHAREDAEIVKDLQLRLNVRGVHSHDVDDLLAGSLVEHKVVHAIEYDADAVVLFLTPDYLKPGVIWRVEVPAALRRLERDPHHFHIIPILQGVSSAEVQQFCYNYNLTDLSRFHGITLTEDGTDGMSSEERNRKLNDVARRILEAAFTLRLRRINADGSHAPWIYLKTFMSTPSTPRLDLDLDWLKLVYEKEHLPTSQEWEQILLPALLDVKHIISKNVPSHRIHLLIQSILPVAIALGFAFREPARITLLLEGQKETWSTEAPPSEKEPLHREWIHNEQGDQQRAVVEVATTFPIKQSVEDTLPVIGVMPGYHIRLELPELSREAVRDAAHAQAIARQVGSVCRELCGLHRTIHIHLFVAIPAALAVLIGHQLNALCPITLYEYIKNERVYKPVGIIR